MKSKTGVTLTLKSQKPTPMEVFKATFGVNLEKLSRSEKLFLIQMAAAQMYATEPEKVKEEVFSGVFFIQHSLKRTEQEELISLLANSLQKASEHES